jgi:hypothetical protein
VSANAQAPEPDFIRHSDTESVCLYSFATVKADYADPQKLEEQLHLILCTAAPPK